ncbi:DMT family transporter [Echinicola vietnamensis]|uniref:Putative permease n=1 Tax=Echinicola vietnamensis (strain DSM 17526 / LMG 23754 / KMM 6221) TaxID=926556 RepID=L0FXK9_ECHVK|nr:DMT family transporter [Echinicola vietnamensis]AGA77788.1 putative permease [Echinicola vietnamensis DSM 17526]
MTTNTAESQPLRSWLLLGFLSLVWGSSFILIKKGLVVFSPGEVGAYRIVSAAAVLLPLSLPRIARLNRKQIGNLMAVGLVGSFLPAFLFAKAQTQLSSSITGVLNALTPLFVVLIGALFFKAKITLRNGLGLLIAFVGVIILISVKEGSSLSSLSSINSYAFLVILATICYGINLNIIKHWFEALKPVEITAISLLLALPVALGYLISQTDFIPKLLYQEGAPLAAGYLTILGVLGTAVSLIVFNGLVKIASPVFASTVTYLIPIVAIAWGVLDGEVLLSGHFIGMIAVITGVWIGNRKKRKKVIPATSSNV